MDTRTRYARNGDVSLAYQVFERGARHPRHVRLGRLVPGRLEAPAHARWLERLGGRP